ncbi:b671614f-6010-49a5-910f-472c3f90e3af [Sclerotinia trifoliorum]|uniref:B671614f-6010-49a5-910f-472c3f90e3af n=1 Tax=Sclerotinia trifoliorum TaxID=28548 RepID=A0A8H2ZN28_9HELO|nr:b671614f-6010-49a5-910f-472c3f90e3af [Sclerotinia trifoliorum]
MLFDRRTPTQHLLLKALMLVTRVVWSVTPSKSNIIIDFIPFTKSLEEEDTIEESYGFFLVTRLCVSIVASPDTIAVCFQYTDPID